MELPIQAPQLVKEYFQTGNLKMIYLSTYGPELKLLPETFLKVTQQAAQHYKTWKLVLKMLFTEPEGTYPTVGLTSASLWHLLPYLETNRSSWKKQSCGFNPAEKTTGNNRPKQGFCLYQYNVSYLCQDKEGNQ